MTTIQEALWELREGRDRKYPLLVNLSQLIRFYDFLYNDKDLGSHLYDPHFALADQNLIPDKNKAVAVDINKQNLDRQVVLLRQFNKTIEQTPGRNLYAALDIDTYGSKGIINIHGWTVHGSSRSLSEFKEYLKEFLINKENYSEEKANEEVLDFLKPDSPAVKILSSKDWGTILQISFALKNQAPEAFKRRKI